MKALGMILAAGLLTLALVTGAVFIERALSSVTIQTQVITPKPGVECVVVNASDSTSVDCWGAGE